MTTPTDNPTLREQLDAVRPDSDDLRDDALQDAAQAIEESDEWREIFERQQAFDREVAAVMQTVEVPDGLKSRLLDSLAAARNERSSNVTLADPPSTVSEGTEIGDQRSEIGGDSDVRPPTSDLPGPTPDSPTAGITRRSALQWAAMSAGLLLAVTLGWLIWPGDGSLITLEQARHQLLPAPEGMIDVTGLSEFDGSFDVQLPDTAWTQRTTAVAELKGVSWNGHEQHVGAVYEFRSGRRVHGYLLILPASRLADRLASTRLGTTGLDYQPVPNAAWVDPTTNLVYICFVDQGDLQDLQRALYPHAA